LFTVGTFSTFCGHFFWATIGYCAFDRLKANTTPTQRQQASTHTTKEPLVERTSFFENGARFFRAVFSAASAAAD